MSTLKSALPCMLVSSQVQTLWKGLFYKCISVVSVFPLSKLDSLFFCFNFQTLSTGLSRVSSTKGSFCSHFEHWHHNAIYLQVTCNFLLFLTLWKTQQIFWPLSLPKLICQIWYLSPFFPQVQICPANCPGGGRITEDVILNMWLGINGSET